MGDVKKVAACKVKPCDLKERENEPREDGEKSPETVERENNSEDDDNNDETDDERDDDKRETENKDEVRRDLQNDIIGAKYLQVEKSVYFMDYEIYSVEVPVKDHGKPDIVEAKNKEIENLKLYETFEEVKDEGQETIGSRWVVTEKQQHDGQKQDYKARLVAKGFQELDQPQSDSPTAAKESFKLIMALSANYNFKIVSIDIRAAFLQVKTLDREVYVKPPQDQEKEGIIWKLLKPLYGLDDASRKFYLKVRETLRNFDLNTLPGEDAVYYQHINGNLIGMLLSHVDDFTITGTNKFVNRIVEGLKKIFTISKIEENNFRFRGLDVKTTEEGIEISMEDYANSIKEIQDIRKASGTEPLTKAELKEYRKYTGKLSWLAQGTRPDLSYSVIDLSKKNNSATIADLRNINRIVEKVKKEENKVIYKKLGNREDLQIIGIVDVSYKVDNKSIADPTRHVTDAHV